MRRPATWWPIWRRMASARCSHAAAKAALATCTSSRASTARRASSRAANAARTIAGELKKYDAALFRKPRWLILNKIDAVNDAPERAAKVLRQLRWKRPWFAISALTGEGCLALTKAIAKELSSNEPARSR